MNLTVLFYYLQPSVDTVSPLLLWFFFSFDLIFLCSLLFLRLSVHLQSGSFPSALLCFRFFFGLAFCTLSCLFFFLFCCCSVIGCCLCATHPLVLLILWNQSWWPACDHHQYPLPPLSFFYSTVTLAFSLYSFSFFNGCQPQLFSFSALWFPFFLLSPLLYVVPLFLLYNARLMEVTFHNTTNQ